MKYLKKAWDFVMKSSADPKQTSASLRFLLLGFIPYIMQALNMVCDFGYQCYDIEPSLLETIFDGIATGVFYLLGLISVIGTVFGLLRKLYRTLTGQNLALVDV